HEYAGPEQTATDTAPAEHQAAPPKEHPRPASVHETGTQQEQLQQAGVSQSEGTEAAPFLPAHQEHRHTIAQQVSQQQPIAATIRVASQRMDKLLRTAENLITVKQVLQETHATLKEILLQLSERTIDAQTLREIQASLASLQHRVDQESITANNLIDTLIEDAQSLLMLPCAYIFDAFPLAAREIARSLGKEVTLDIKGQEIELEKKILEKLKDPLMHILRNSIDHGIEPPQERRALGKPARGTISITVSHRNARELDLTITDDGRGIDFDRIRAIAVARNLFSEDEARNATEQQLLDLLFTSGFSTSPIITDLSGRGLGLAIVRQAIEELDGSIHVESVPGRSTRFHITLPYGKSSFKGHFVLVQGQRFVIPSAAVVQAVRVQQQDILTAGNAEVIDFHGEVIGLVHLGTLLGLPPSMEQQTPAHVLALVCRYQDRACAFIVDELHGEHDVLTRPLGTLLGNVRLVQGATIAGGNAAIPILNVHELLDSAFSMSTETAPPAAARQESRKKKRILIVEDSVTSRTLLKSILSAAGYEVQTAVDGIEGYTLLKSEPFDCVVSDVEMPRLDGFGLTERIRQDPALAKLPVILVTGLESREHKEKGIAVGANAYITKSGFVQNNLLETIRRFI
ncbi:MAG: response regulator, partial [Rectinemataceae bacterium]